VGLWLSNDVWRAYKTNTVIKWGVELPDVVERLLRIPDVAFLRQTVKIGIFAVELSTIVYLGFVALSQLTLFLVVRPLLLSFLNSLGDTFNKGEPSLVPPAAAAGVAAAGAAVATAAAAAAREAPR